MRRGRRACRVRHAGRDGRRRVWMTWQQEWIDRFYKSRPGWKDGTTEFHELCRAHAPLHARILEVGAGATNTTSAFLASLGELHGVDLADEIRGNVHLTAA